MRNPAKLPTRILLAGASILVGLVAHTVCADYSNTVASFNPLGYWRFNETAASPVPNKVANSGSVGSAGDGYVVLDVGKGEPGKVGNSIRLVNADGAVGYCGSKVDVPFNAALNPTAPFSIEFWIKPNHLGGDTTGSSPLSSFNPNWFGGANRSGWLFYLNNVGVWQFRLGLTGGYAVQLSASGGNGSIGTWQHIAATYDGNTARIYVDGVLRGTGAVAAGWKPNTQMALRMGGTSLYGSAAEAAPNFISGSGIAGNRGFDGWLDEVAIYPSLLSDSTIAAHHDAAATNSAGYGAQILASGPLGYWNLNEPSVAPPNPSTLPIAVNSGSVGAAATGTNTWGAVAAQSGATFPGFGAGNNATFFNGESGYLALGDDPALHFSGQITMAAWVKPQVQDFFRDIIAHGWDANYAETFLRISRGYTADNDGYGDGNYYEVGVSDGQTYYVSALYPIPAGDIGKWVFVAGTYDGANWSLYRNGQLVATIPSDSGALDVASRWSIGSRSGPSPTTGGGSATLESEGLFFGGYIDEPAIFNTALSAANISALYSAAQAPPVITQGPVTPVGTIYEGSTVTFTVWAEGAPTLKYFWTKDGVPNGVTTTNLTLTGVTVASSGTYGVIVTNDYGSNFASAPLTVVASAPIITKQPQSVTRFAGSPFSFSVSTIGSTPQTYYWTKGTTVVQSGSSPSYSGVASAGDAGGYYCVISNHIAPFTTTSSTGVLTVLAVPSGYAGAVIGSTPAAYWRLGETNGTTAGDYIGGHDGTYFNATLNQPGYSAIDPDRAAGFGAVNSYVGSISGNPATGGVNFSGHVNFTVEVWANGPAGQGDESTIIAKGSGSSGTTATEQFGIDILGGKYRFFTRGGGNSLYEADANVGPNGTWQHVVGVYDDTAATMTIYVNGESAGSGGTRPAGLRASSDPVSIGSKHLGNDPAFDGYFTGIIDEVAVYPVALSASTIQAHYAAAYGPSLAPVIDLQPQSVTNYAGLPVTISVAAHGTVPLTYQWKKGGVDISGATLSSYTISPLALSDAGDYSVGITNGINPGVLSASAHLTVLSAPTSPPAIPGLVLHLPFDNNLTDVTGRGNNGVGIHRVQNLGVVSSNVTAPTFVSGQLGSGLHFVTTATDASGTNWDNSYVSLNDRPDLHFSSNVNFTVAFWVKNGDAIAAQWGDLPFLCSAAGSTFSAPGLVFAWTYGTGATPYIGGWAFSMYDTAGNGVGGRGAQGSIDDGSWHHLAHVFDRQGGNVNYLDGVPVAFGKQAGTSTTAAQNIDSGSWFTIGQDPTGVYGEAGSGSIDDLGIWKKALTPLEVATIFIAGVSNNLSYVGAPYLLSEVRSGNSITLRWDVGVLQQATAVGGPYSDVTGASSPITVTPSAAAPTKYYRIRL